MSRTATIDRETKETTVSVTIDLDGTGTTDISTGLPFFDHMLDQLGRHHAVRRLPSECRAREHGEGDAAGALVLGERAASALRRAGGARRGALVLDADVRQQARQQRLVHAVGVDRVGHADALRENGADVVVTDLAELLTSEDTR